VSTSTRPVPARLPELLDIHLRPLVADARVPAVAAAAIRGDATALLATGRRGRGSPEVVDTGTAFQLGSVSKTFTGLLLAEMATSGLVTFDTPVSDLLPPDIRPRSRRKHHGQGEATLCDLATHTAGLPRLPRDLYRRALLRWIRNPYTRYSNDNLYRAYARLPPVHSPSPRGPRYSTFGIALLGQLLAEAAGTGFPELLAERVLRPLQMDGGGVPPSMGSAPVATGHRHGRPVPTWTFDAFAPAGAVHATAADLLRYLHAHLHPDALPPELASAVRSVQRPRRPMSGRAASKGTSVALVWSHRVVRGQTMLWHTGATGGFTAFAAFSPTAVAVVANAKTVRNDPVLRAARRLFRAVTFDPAPSRGG
jgi:D-alanyl-D-alanine-carboxypeptidase/D-alanyl-D-alanine-endopeptidase